MDVQNPLPVWGEGRVRAMDATGRSRRLRRDQTDAERTLWSLLRSRQLGGYKFRRQHSFGPYILDFYCAESRLAIELDGGQHYTAEGRESDDERTRYLSGADIRVIRFSNHDALTNAEGVVQTLLRALIPSPPAP